MPPAVAVLRQALDEVGVDRRFLDRRTLTPLDVADSRFLRAGDLGDLPVHLRRKLAGIPGPMSQTRRPGPPRWLPPDIPGSHGFTGRFPDLWRVHSALTAAARSSTWACARASPRRSGRSSSTASSERTARPSSSCR